MGVFNTYDLIHKQRQKSAKTAILCSTVSSFNVQIKCLMPVLTRGCVQQKKQAALLAATFQHPQISMKKMV